MSKCRMEKLIGTHLNPVEFAKFYFDWEPYDYQKKPLLCDAKRQLLVAGRQTGKTEITALKGLYMALWWDNATILIVAPTQRQSGILFKRMKSFINISAQKLPELKLPEEITRETRTILEFFNGSEIYSLPATRDGDNLRGFTTHGVIMDEAEKIEDDVFTVISPMLATTDGTLILLGTPMGVNNYFYRAYKDEKYGFKTFKFTSDRSPAITDDFLKQEMNRLTRTEFEQEYMAKFIDETDTFFPINLIDSAMDSKLTERDSPLASCDYFLGVDLARFGKDDAVFMILERHGSGIDLVKIVSKNGMSLTDQRDYIKYLDNIWDFKKIVVDETGIGGGPVDDLHSDGYNKVEGIMFTLKSKQEIFNWLKLKLQDNSLRLMQNRELRKQMNELKYEYNPLGYIKIYHPAKTGEDDYPTALALACWGIKGGKGQIIFGSPKKNFWGD